MGPEWFWLGIILCVVGIILLFACSIDRWQGKELSSRKLGWGMALALVGAILVGAYTYGGMGPPERKPHYGQEIKSVFYIPPSLGGIFIS